MVLGLAAGLVRLALWLGPTKRSNVKTGSVSPLDDRHVDHGETRTFELFYRAESSMDSKVRTVLQEY